MYVVGNLGAIGNERIDAVTLTDRQIISQRTPIGANRSWSQAQLNLELEPCRRDRMPITAGQRSVASELSTRRRLSTEFTERVFSPALPLSQRPLRLRLLLPRTSIRSIPHNLETGLVVALKSCCMTATRGPAIDAKVSPPAALCCHAHGSATCAVRSRNQATI